MKRMLLILAMFVVPVAHAHGHKDKLQECYAVESSRFDCDELDDDQLNEVIETGGGLDGYEG